MHAVWARPHRQTPNAHFLRRLWKRAGWLSYIIFFCAAFSSHTRTIQSGARETEFRLALSPSLSLSHALCESAQFRVRTRLGPAIQALCNEEPKANARDERPDCCGLG